MTRPLRSPGASTTSLSSTASWLPFSKSHFNVDLESNDQLFYLSILFLPNSGPDTKYFLGFLRTQLSTTTTMILVFGPKFRRVIAGTGDDAEDKNRRWQLTSMVRPCDIVYVLQLHYRNVSAKVGIPINSANQMDVYQENEELKEELQKLAAKVGNTNFLQIFDCLWKVEFYKIVGMISTNQHIKPSRNAHFAPGISRQVRGL